MITHTLGFSRMGKQRELKKALEAFWKGETKAAELQSVAGEIRLRHWTLQKQAGIDILPVGDFSLYDHMLDMSALLGAVPTRYDFQADTVDQETYFLMARRRQQKRPGRGRHGNVQVVRHQLSLYCSGTRPRPALCPAQHQTL